MVAWLGLLVPIVYLSILTGSLATFSSLYRKRKLAAQLSLEPWFPPHLQRNIYLSLLHLEPLPGQEKAPNVPDSVLKAALLQRACEDIRRILAVRNAKPALSTLLQRGSVGDDLWQRYLRAEKEIEAELKDVVEEANALQANWGQTIFQSANEMISNAAIKEKINAITEKTQKDKIQWEQDRQRIQASFMQELERDKDAVAERNLKEEGLVGDGGNISSSASSVVGSSGGASGSGSGSVKKRKAGKK